MMDQLPGAHVAGAQRVVERGEHQRCRRARVGGPADDPVGERIPHAGQPQHALTGDQPGSGRPPEQVRGAGPEVALDHIGSGPELTTQEAADLLNVSRPYLIGLIDQATLPCTRTAGNHRRLRLADVLTYKRARDTERRAALDEMSAEAERLGLRY
ncbi:MAG: helix-turn-helix domain-containing protein [Pseudonocardiaceae bacterium]|nr:helix-turn-helix domain-containing protein [Pseudonocardiaceae bacterium]